MSTNTVTTIPVSERFAVWSSPKGHRWYVIDCGSRTNDEKIILGRFRTKREAQADAAEWTARVAS